MMQRLKFPLPWWRNGLPSRLSRANLTHIKTSSIAVRAFITIRLFLSKRRSQAERQHTNKLESALRPIISRNDQRLSCRKILNASIRKEWVENSSTRSDLRVAVTTCLIWTQSRTVGWSNEQDLDSKSLPITCLLRAAALLAHRQP